MAMPETTKAQKAEEDAYTLVRAEESRREAQEIRKDGKRFAAAVKVIRRQNQDRRKAMAKEMAARKAAVEQ